MRLCLLVSGVIVAAVCALAGCGDDDDSEVTPVGTVDPGISVPDYEYTPYGEPETESSTACDFNGDGIPGDHADGQAGADCMSSLFPEPPRRDEPYDGPGMKPEWWHGVDLRGSDAPGSGAGDR